MDGKYAKYIENFMKGFTSTKETTEIYALNNTKRPLVYETTSELIESKNNKLNDQYSTIIKKQDEIKANEFKKLEKTSKLFGIITTLAIIITILLFVPSITASVNFIIPQIGTVISLLLGTTYAGLKTKLEIGKKKFEQDMDMISFYKKNRGDIERIMETDENLTRYLSQKTQAIIEEKEELQKAGLTSEVMDIDLMDQLLDKNHPGRKNKANLRKDLIILLEMYKAIISVNKKPTYIAPIEKEPTQSKSKTKTLTETNK